MVTCSHHLPGTNIEENFKVALLCAMQAAAVCARAESGYDDGGRPDPFIPWVTADGRLQILVSQEKKRAEQLKIEGIIYDGRGLSYAVVNGEVVKVGDLIDGYQVLKIEEDKVIVIKEGQPKEIVIEEEGL